MPSICCRDAGTPSTPDAEAGLRHQPFRIFVVWCADDAYERGEIEINRVSFLPIFSASLGSAKISNNSSTSFSSLTQNIFLNHTQQYAPDLILTTSSCLQHLTTTRLLPKMRVRATKPARCIPTCSSVASLSRATTAKVRMAYTMARSREWAIAITRRVLSR